MLVKIAATGARAAGAEVTYIDLRDLPMPLFDEDLEAKEGMPENVRKFKELMTAHQGLLIASPEYNSSITAVLQKCDRLGISPATGGTRAGSFQQ
jgi:Predicted flavoprotein